MKLLQIFGLINNTPNLENRKFDRTFQQRKHFAGGCLLKPQSRLLPKPVPLLCLKVNFDLLLELKSNTNVIK